MVLVQKRRRNSSTSKARLTIGEHVLGLNIHMNRGSCWCCLSDCFNQVNFSHLSNLFDTHEVSYIEGSHCLRNRRLFSSSIVNYSSDSTSTLKSPDSRYYIPLYLIMPFLLQGGLPNRAHLVTSSKKVHCRFKILPSRKHLYIFFRPYHASIISRQFLLARRI